MTRAPVPDWAGPMLPNPDLGQRRVSRLRWGLAGAIYHFESSDARTHYLGWFVASLRLGPLQHFFVRVPQRWFGLYCTAGVQVCFELARRCPDPYVWAGTNVLRHGCRDWYRIPLDRLPREVWIVLEEL